MGTKKKTYLNNGPIINERPTKVSGVSIVKRIWNRFLDAIAWLTQDQSRITKKKSRREIDYIRLRGINKS